MPSSNMLEDYQRLTQSSGFVVLPGRTIIKVSGKDRLTFIHNFCTADVKNLSPGNSTEAFILNPQGKLIGYVFLISGEEELFINTVGGQFATIRDHLDKFIMREDVQLIDTSDETVTIFVAGPDSNAKLAGLFEKLPEMGEFVDVTFATSRIGVAKVDLAGDGFLMMVPQACVDNLKTRLAEHGIGECSQESLHARRVEQKTPWFGIDASESNLPQELQRDAAAISFTKGCYLGQETVARIDSLGHVNQLLVGLELDREASSGTELMADEKLVGRLCSTSWSPARQSWLGLGYVKRKYCSAGTRLDFSGGQATVC